MRNLALLLVRLTTGSLLAGHGAQKLFGAFGGHGLKGTAGWLESMGLRPGTTWATMAGGAEFGGGVLTALGLFHPLGPIGVIAAMSMATTKAHWGKPIWATSGGAELPVTYMSIALALTMVDPGKYSLDHAFGIKVPRAVVILTALAAAAGVAQGMMREPEPSQGQQTGQDQATTV